MALPIITYTINGKTYTADHLTQGVPGIILVTQKEDGQVFYRTKWQGEIAFVGDDYRRFWKIIQQTCCQTISIALYRTGVQCSTSSPYWKGVFNLSDLKFNNDEAIARLAVVPRPDDGYQTLLENWSKELNWLDINIVQSIYCADRTILYRRARSLIQLITGMVNLTLKDTRASSLIPIPGVDTVSQFLESPLNPVTRAANYLRYAVCIQASDFTTPGDPKGGDPLIGFATKATLTLKALVEELQDLFCLYPYIDPETGKLRWEHESFFPGQTYGPPVAGYSLPNTYAGWDGKRTLETSLDDLYGQYTLKIETNKSLFAEQSADNTPYQFPVILNNPYDLPDLPIGAPVPDDPTVPIDFSRASIDFSSYCVSRQAGEEPLVKTRTVSRFCTYVTGARTNPDSVDKANWIFLVESAASQDPFNQIPQIAYGITETHGVNTENGNLSASILVRDFHRHNKPFYDGFFSKSARYLPNGIRRVMLSVAPVRQLGRVSVSYCCADTPVSLSGQITTWLATDGQLIRGEYTPSSDLLTLDIAHAGPCQIAPSVAFDPNGAPLPCPPKGQVLRLEQSTQYPPGNSIFPCIVSVDTIYTDGACGEYRITDKLLNGTC